MKPSLATPARVVLVLSIVLGSGLEPALSGEPRPMEYLDRGLVALEVKGGVFLSWRMLGTDAPDIGFNLYRNGRKINDGPITQATNHTDAQGKAGDKYRVEALTPGGDTESPGEAEVWPRRAPSAEKANPKGPAVPYKEIPIPEAPEGEYTPGDMSVGDLDGDGRYELIFEWEGDSPHLEAIDLDGNRFWRISLGPNVTYNGVPFLVYDFDGDGRAEIACVTAPGTRDGTGAFLNTGPAAGANHAAVHKRIRGRLVEDPAFITVFDGATGRERVTIPFWPSIGPEAKLKENWGDNYGHRAGSIKGAVLYTTDHGPLAVFSRGIYSRIAMKAYAFDGKDLKAVWTFDSEDPSGRYLGYRAQGNHSLAVGDVDGDGSDELIYGACAIDHDGKGLYTTGWGHGDSHALAKHDPDLPGLQFYQGHEGGEWGVTMRDAATGRLIWGVKDKGDIGRAWAADVDPGYRGSESSSVVKPRREPVPGEPEPFKHQNLDAKGNEIPTKYNAFSQPVYFDGRPQRALRNGTNIDGDGGRLLTGWHYGASTVHSTKNDANLVADILGDWREEIVFLRGDKRAFLLFSTWIPTERKNPALMHDPVYRMNVVVQHVGYNQPAHTGYYFADGAPAPEIGTARFAGAAGR